MSLRTRLVIFVLLFGSTVLVNVSALIYLARSISQSLDAIELIRQRQLVTVQMNAHLRDAEAALYRYQINGEAGFKLQFHEQLEQFSREIAQYRLLASQLNEQQWASELERAYQQALTTGSDLIELHDDQAAQMDGFLATQSQLSAFLSTEALSSRPDDPAYQAIVAEMHEASRAMLAAVTGYLASPDETKRGQFTDAVVSFQQGMNDFSSIARSDEEKAWAADILSQFSQLKSLGTGLIGGRDLQQSLYANFISIVFNAGQQTIVGKIQP
ncbi:MAG: hypothetical protein AB1564_14120, partial [Chloroflexota bacterium]